MSQPHRRLQSWPFSSPDLAPRAGRGARPDWLPLLTETVSDLFDPLSEFARVGFECRLADDRWEIGFYLGRLERVGGKLDGVVETISFRFDLQRLMAVFDSVEQVEWLTTAPAVSEGTNEPGYLIIQGVWQKQPVRILIHEQPPVLAGPGLRRHADGRWETV